MYRINPACVFLVIFGLQFHYGSAGACDGSIEQLVSKTEQGFVRSPNYPNAYFNNELCRWNIEVEDKELQVVRFKIQNSHIRNSVTCGEDYVEVKDGANSRTIRKWCGEQIDVMHATSSSGSIIITFKTDGKYTDMGFEIAYWSVPKSLIEFQEIKLRTVNYILFAIFVGIIVCISLGMILIVLKRRTINKQEALLEEERRVNMFSVHVETNGKIANGNMNTTGMAETKRTSANNGEAKGIEGNKTHIISLEPALTDQEPYHNTMTPV